MNGIEEKRERIARLKRTLSGLHDVLSVRYPPHFVASDIRIFQRRLRKAEAELADELQKGERP